jgi:hypothetical protein
VVLAVVGFLASTAGRAEVGLPTLVGGLGGVVILLWWISQRARVRAETEWMTAWGASHGLRFAGDPGEPPGAAPLLRLGHRRTLERAVVGLVADDPAAMLGHYTYWEQQTDGSGKRRERAYPFTVLVLDRPGTAALLPLLSAQPRGRLGGVFDGLGSALSSSRVVELESVDLHGAFRIVVDDDQADLAVRRVFTPAFMVWLAALGGSDLRFELEHGCLVVAVPEHSFDAERLDWLLGAGTEIARRVAAVAQDRS